MASLGRLSENHLPEAKKVGSMRHRPNPEEGGRRSTGQQHLPSGGKRMSVPSITTNSGKAKASRFGRGAAQADFQIQTRAKERVLSCLCTQEQVRRKFTTNSHRG